MIRLDSPASAPRNSYYGPLKQLNKETVVGVIFLVVGFPFAIWPYEAARSEKQTAAIGSTQSWYEVEPGDWFVAFARIAGIVMGLVGTWILIVS